MTSSIAITALAGILLVALTNPPRTEVDPERFRSENFLLDPDDWLGFKLKPHVTILDSAGTRKFVVYTDGRGARVSRPEEESMQTDILLVGCSQAFGHGVANEATFISLVARRLGKTAVNLSVSGYGGVSALERLRRNLDLRPRLVVYGLWEDHLNRNVRRCIEHNSPVCLERPYIRFDESGRPVIEYPSHSDRNVALTRRWYMETAKGTNAYRTVFTDVFWTAYRFATMSYEAVFGIEEPVSFERKLDAMRYVLSEMKRAADSVGAKLAVVWTPLYFSDTITQPPDELVAHAERERILWVNMAGPFETMKRNGIPIAIAGDGHMTEAAHKAVASEILRALAER